MTSTHTPGTWSYAYEFGKHGVLATTTGGKFIAICGAADDDPEKNAERLANCRLISAAPDLLEALEWAERALSPFSVEPQEKSGINMVRAALRKARGS